MCNLVSDSPAIPICGSLIAFASKSRKEINQDQVGIADNPAIGTKAVIVADGIGSHFRAEYGASQVIKAATVVIERLEREIRRADIGEICKSSAALLRDEATKEINSDLRQFDPDQSFGTTMVIACESKETILLGYLGNGALIHVRGDFATLPTSQLMPWSAINYLNPHSRSQNGKNVLYKFISPNSTDAQLEPTVFEITKDESFYGDIIIVASDGISSYDQTQMGRDSEGGVWISGEKTLLILFDILASFLQTGPFTNEHLTARLVQYLETLDNNLLISDDCTLGVLVTAQALTFNASRVSQLAVSALDNTE